MAHSRILQFEICKQSEYDKYDIEVLNEYTLSENQLPDFVDYTSETYLLEKDFERFVASLPEGVFDMNKEEMSLTYIKRPDDYIKNYFDTIKAEANKLSVDDFYNCKCSTWKLEKVLKNFENHYMIYSSAFDYAMYLKNWIIQIVQCEKIGTKFYLGGVLDYHY